MKNKRYRLLMEKAAHDKLENGIFPVLDHLAENESQIVDLQDVFQRFTFDVICMTVLGYNPSSLNIDLQDVPLAKAFDDIDKGMFERHVVPETMWKLQRLLGLGAEKWLAVATERFDKFLYDFISSKREKIVRQQTTMDKEELVDLLTAHIEGETRKEDVVEYSTFKDDKLLRDMVINLLAAGRSTIAVALVWFFWSMANNPRVESKVLAELADNPPAPHHSDDDHSSCRRRQSRLYCEEEVNRLVYLHATVAETLRLHTPTPMNHKWAREADVLPSGHRVRAKTRIYVSMYAMGRMKGIWGEDCREFKPERWITERGGIRYVPSHQFTTFSGGPRSCLGKEVSLIQLKMVVAAILWRYKFQVVEGHRVSYTMSTVLQMENELRVSVSWRST
ncbi:unnamed protein product [Linum trigynum]|uniref:Cytochrome P450 n=1 Tax=Linum trigynum TaxID=586398 RepID=A0AAV2FJQ7_9ROSI